MNTSTCVDQNETSIKAKTIGNGDLFKCTIENSNKPDEYNRVMNLPWSTI